MAHLQAQTCFTMHNCQQHSAPQRAHSLTGWGIEATASGFKKVAHSLMRETATVRVPIIEIGLYDRNESCVQDFYAGQYDEVACHFCLEFSSIA